VFLLVPAHPGSPGQRTIEWLLCVVVVTCAMWSHSEICHVGGPMVRRGCVDRQ